MDANQSFDKEALVRAVFSAQMADLGLLFEAQHLRELGNAGHELQLDRGRLGFGQRFAGAVRDGQGIGKGNPVGAHLAILSEQAEGQIGLVSRADGAGQVGRATQRIAALVAALHGRLVGSFDVIRFFGFGRFGDVASFAGGGALLRGLAGVLLGALLLLLV